MERSGRANAPERNPGSLLNKTPDFARASSGLRAAGGTVREIFLKSIELDQTGID
jgi:hypothetical protein